MRNVRPMLGTALFAALLLSLGCAQTQGSTDASEDNTVALDRQDETDAPTSMDADARVEVVGDASEDATGSGDTPRDFGDTGDAAVDGSPMQDARDAGGDLPIVVVPPGTGGECNELQLHSVVSVTHHTTPPPWPLRRGMILPGLYVLSTADYYPDREEDGGLAFGWTLYAYTMRVRSDISRIEIALAIGLGDELSKLNRLACTFNPRSPDPYYFCPLSCVGPTTGRVGNPAFVDFDGVGDRLLIRFGNYLLTLQRVGPP